MNIIVYFFAYMMEDFTIWFYCNLISDPKQKKYYNLIYISFVYLSLWLFCFFQNVYLNLFLFAITTYFIIHWLYSISKLPALFHSLVIFLSMTLSELFVASICSHFIIQYWHHWTDTNLFIFQTIISKMIYLLIMYVLARLQKKQFGSPSSPTRPFSLFSIRYNFLFYVCQHPVIYFWLTVSRKFLKQLHNFYYNSVAPRHIISGLCTLQLQQ